MEPTPAGDRFFSTPFPTFDHTGIASLRFGMVTGYAYRPLIASVMRGGTTVPVTAIEHSLVTHAQFNAHLVQRLGLDLSLPIYWVQSGATDPGLPVRAADGVTLGDLRLGVRARIVGHAERNPASLHLGATGHVGFLGLSSPAQSATEGRFRARIFAAGAGSAGPLRWSASAGVHLRPGFSAPYTTITNELFATAGLAVALLREQLEIGAETWVSTALEQPFARNTTALEALLGVRALLLQKQLQLGLAAGPGITQAPGTPTFRALLSLSYTFSVQPAHPSTTTTTATTNTANTANTTTQGPTQTVGNAVVGAAPEPPAEPPPARPAAELSYCAGADCSTGDRDNDQVMEPLDQCPDTAAGTTPDPERAGCPAPDADHDGVLDREDQCPEQARGMVPDPARNGCPLPDRDEDHIADAQDHCPEQAGAPHPDPQLNGCPGLVRLDEGVLRILQPIFFAPGRATIQPRSIPVLEGVRQALQARPEIRRMIVEGHTDDRGNDEINVDLSHRRADAVVRWLTDHGIDPRRISPQGFGPTRPLVALQPTMNNRARNDARARNRRVQFELVTP